MKSKSLLTLGLLALGLTHAAAQSTYREPPLPSVNGKVTLEVWTWLASMPEAVKLFEQKYPNITVKVTNLGGDTFKKLQTALRAGTGGPDLASAQFQDLPALIYTGGVADISKYGATAAKNYFVPWTWRQVSPDGRAVYAIPQDSGPFAMIYRKDVFDKYGLKVPRTWAEYETEAAKLAKASGGKVKMGNFHPNEPSFFYALVWGAGGRLFTRSGDTWTQTLNSPEAKKVGAYWERLIKQGYVSTYSRFAPDFAKPMSGGMIATSMEPAWGASNFALNLDPKSAGLFRVAQVPQWNAGTFKTGNWGGSSTLVTTQSKNPAAATLFAIWLNSYQNAVASNWKVDGLFPAASAGLTLPALHVKTDKTAAFFGGQDVTSVFAQASRGVDTNFTWAPWLPKVDAAYRKNMDAALKGQVSFSQALDRWQAESLSAARADGYNVQGK